MYYCASHDNITVSKNNYTFVEGKVQDQILVYQILKKHQIDAVLHLLPNHMLIILSVKA